MIPVIQSGGFVFVTNNARHLLALYAKEEVQPGLIIIIPGSIGREKQVELFGRALDMVEPLPDIVNKVVEVFSDGTVEIRDWPDSNIPKPPGS